MPRTNTVVKLASHPANLPTPDNLQVEQVELPAIAEGQVLVKVLFISLDPTMRGWMLNQPSYLPPIRIGEVIRALGVGQVAESKHPDFAVGDYVMGGFGVQQWAVVDGNAAQNGGSLFGLLKIDPALAAPETYLATLGMPGMAAYFGLFTIGQPRVGETVVVSAAAGAVGSVAGQLARLQGCRVIGIAGGAEKCAYCVQELGFEACLDYKAGDLAAALQAACPDGVDVYFDNVGGDTLDAVLAQLRPHARIAVCGAIASYADDKPGLRNHPYLIRNRGRMEGFVVVDFQARFADAARQMGGWLQEGKMQPPKLQIEHGVENFLPAFLKLYSGDNFGKLLLAT